MSSQSRPDDVLYWLVAALRSGLYSAMCWLSTSHLAHLLQPPHQSPPPATSYSHLTSQHFIKGGKNMR